MGGGKWQGRWMLGCFRGGEKAVSTVYYCVIGNVSGYLG